MRTSRSRTGSPPRGMEAIGLNIGETNRRNLSQRRLKKGECPTCGIRTHKIGMFGKKTPLTVEGECVYGRCLRCRPVEGYQIRPPNAHGALPSQAEPVGVGRDIIVDDDDDAMSGITMDPALRESSTRWRPGTVDIMDDLDEGMEDFADFPPPPRMPRRPEPSVGGEDDFHPFPTTMQQSGVQQQRSWMNSMGDLDPTQQLGEPSRPQHQMHSARRPQRYSDMHVAPPSPKPPSRRLSPHHKNMAPLRLPSEIEEETSDQKLSSVSSGPQEESGSSGIEYPAPVTHSNEEEAAPNHNSYPKDLQYYDEEEEKNEIQAPQSEPFREDPWPNQDPNFTSNIVKNSRKEHRLHLGKSSTEQADVSFILNNGRQMDGRGSMRHRSPLAERPHHRPRKLSPTSTDLQFIPDSVDGHVVPPKHSPVHRPQHGRKPPSPPLTLQPTTRPGQRSKREIVRPQPFDDNGNHVSDIPGIIRQLVSRDSDAKIRGEAFRSLADLIWSNGDEAKLVVQQNHGIESVVESMWEDLGNPDVQAAAVDLLFALSACSEDGMGRDIFMGGSARNAIDALLISMQTHISVERLQRSGCGALGCLASASKENERVDDGTLSGAVSCVVAAMDAHRGSAEVQKWGLWALYCQCVLSHNAENSQMNLAKGASEAGGMNVIFRALDVNESDMMVLEWGCKLCWSLSFSDEICGMLTESNRTITVLMKVFRSYQSNAEAGAVEEAAFGSLANIARIKKTHNWIRESQVIARVFDSMDKYHSAEGLNTEACALLANLAECQPLKEAVLSYGVDKIFRAMEKFPDSEDFHGEALRALLCLSVGSEEAKAKLSTEESLSLIIDAITCHQRSPLLLETGFALLAALCVGKSTESADLSDVVGLLIMAMQQFSVERKLQEVACLLLRNLSCREQELVIASADFFPSLLNVMKTQSDSDVVQLNLCCVLSNLLAKERGVICSKVDDGMNQIVTVIQSHMESAAVLEVACSALWYLISISDECKTAFVETGGVEYVKTALLMHPDSPNTLEKACGVLSCLSGSPSHGHLVAEDQGISYVVEAMRTHTTSLALLEYASIILRNAVLGSINNAPEASGGISTMVAALKDNPGATTFQIEACEALWVMAAHSEDCRQKILALDGLAVLMELLDNDDVEADVRGAVNGAFNQLAIPISD